MKVVTGWVCPDLLSGPGNYLGRCPHTDAAWSLTTKRRVAIQAGGHIGTVPCYLANIFERVYTFEPDPENHAALVANTFRRFPDTIITAQGVLGQHHTPVAMLKSTRSTGQHRVRRGAAGAIPSYRIDDLGLADVDAIFLDVEGFEIPALRGGYKTIRQWRPVIQVEENKRAVDQGFAIGAVGAMLQEWGYVERGRIADDIVFTHAG